MELEQFKYMIVVRDKIAQEREKGGLGEVTEIVVDLPMLEVGRESDEKAPSFALRRRFLNPVK